MVVRRQAAARFIRPVWDPAAIMISKRTTAAAVAALALPLGGAPAAPAQDGTQAQVQSESSVTTDARLPFTGRDELILAAAGIALLGAGAAVRRLARAPAGRPRAG